MGRYFNAVKILNILDDIRRVCPLTPAQQVKLNGIEKRILGEEQHDSGTIARNNYRVFIDTESQPFHAFSSFRTKAKSLKRNIDGTSSRAYQHTFSEAFDVERLSYHPRIRPSFNHILYDAVQPSSDIPDAGLEDKRRHGRATNMTIAEQNCQAFYLTCWYGKYKLLKELAATDDVCYKAEIKKMEDTMRKAQACWDAKWTKKLSEHLQEGVTMVSNAIRKCSPCNKRKREDSDDDESPSKYNKPS